MILDLGGGGKSLWFARQRRLRRRHYTDPAGDFSTLAANCGGGYTRTLTDGTRSRSIPAARRRPSIDPTAMHTTYA